jgi:CubicO group peptidase (beta-lactamase class C family)
MPPMTPLHESSDTIPRRTALARLGAAALAVAAPISPVAPFATSAPQTTDEEFERLMRLASVPSMSMASIDGERITTRSLGVRRAGEAERVTPDTVYAAASLSKAVFSYVLLGLVRDGLLSLDRPVREYLPLPNPDDPRAAAITARRLLSHSGGWRNWRNNASQALTADFEPGARWSYSGEGFFFLQRIVEKLTGKGMSLLARERVFEPLGMKRSSMAGLAELEPYQASGHNNRGEFIPPFGRATLLELRRLMAARGAPLDAARVEDSEQAIKTAEPTQPVLPNFLSPNAAGSLLTTAADFGIFLRHLVTARRRGGPAGAIVDLMMSPQIRCNDAVQWGLGVGLEDFGGRRFAWQWGDNPGFKNFCFADPENEKAMVIFTNGDRGARVYERVIRAMTGDDHPAFLWV